ncbi:unnamed protein product, partial [marine sediment metagenome]
EAPPVEFEGTITKKELRHNSAQDTIPASAEIGEEGIVFIWGRNDMTTNQKMGIEWSVHDPDGSLVQEWDQWETWHTGPGLEQGFMGPTFPITKEGSYYLDVYLKMNYDNPVIVNEWHGVLCTTEVLQGTITIMQLEYDGVRKDIPVSDVWVGNRGLVLIWGRNDTSLTRLMGIKWTVYDPDGQVADEYSAFEWPPGCPPGDEHGFIGNSFPLDKEGTYTIEVDLKMNPADPVVVDSYSGVLCTTTTEVPPEYELIHETIYHFAYIYDGEVEETTATFKTDPFTPSAWMGEQFAKKLEEEYRARGGNVLEVRVYVDVTPLLWT